VPPSRLDLRLTLTVDPAVTSPEDAADWLRRFDARRAGAVPARVDTAPGVEPVGGPLDTVGAQLHRLTAFSPGYADRVRRIHEGLAELGYVATVPRPRRAEQPPSYLSYLDPASGRNLGNLNSEKFYVMRRDLRDELAEHPLVGADTRYAHVALVSDEAVEHVLSIARDHRS
jgi:hypothetical protein